MNTEVVEERVVSSRFKSLRWVCSENKPYGVPFIVNLKIINGEEVVVYSHLKYEVELTYADGHTDTVWFVVPGEGWKRKGE